jgi:hypothetical protein
MKKYPPGRVIHENIFVRQSINHIAIAKAKITQIHNE